VNQADSPSAVHILEPIREISVEFSAAGF